MPVILQTVMGIRCKKKTTMVSQTSVLELSEFVSLSPLANIYEMCFFPFEGNQFT